MTSDAKTVDEYIAGLPDDRKDAVSRLRDVINANIPEGFSEQMSYGHIGWVVPHSLYPAGYHCDPKLPLPFVSVASQKNFVALYHMSVYANPVLSQWFTEKYQKISESKLDMGKSCIRFKKPERIPFELVGELMKKVTVDEWIRVYETTIKNPRKTAAK
jgi:uncharacterized protein YdhG (YjbR/CyaY superfamily)